MRLWNSRALDRMDVIVVYPGHVILLETTSKPGLESKDSGFIQPVDVRRYGKNMSARSPVSVSGLPRSLQWVSLHHFSLDTVLIRRVFVSGGVDGLSL